MNKTDEKIIVDNPRTIYSLAMTAILFEIYNSGIFKSQNSLMVGLNLIILLLILGQLSFLLIRGLSLADVKTEKRAKILEFSDWFYSYIFQASVIITIVLVVLSETDYIFNQFGVPKTLFYKLLSFLIFFFSIIIGMYIWKKFFNITKTKIHIYAVMILWGIIGFYLIIFRL
jgi:hypothetical protein